ncbi:ISL3 family transposase [Marinilabiliaceae bacterium JC017]|nr:ISL3 family transposase [Marinilabiliaceae bacterium JC017]
MTIERLMNIPDIIINNIESTCATIKIYASIKGKRSKCPICGKYSSIVHDHYLRTLSDLPVFQNKTIIILKSRKFKCKNTHCYRKVFSEQTQSIVRYSRRTLRVSEILDSLSIELTGKLGSILSKKMLIKVSKSTITRIAHSQPLPQIKQPKVLGIDDWAYRKGVSYGTILIDMETSRPIDLLPSREGADLKKWITEYSDVEIVTRDRASSYSSAIDEVCPNAVQVADRFHLLMNLSDALDKYFKSINPKINNLIKEKSDEILNESNDGSKCQEKEGEPLDSGNRQQLCECKTDQRTVVFKKVKELQKQNVAIKKISRDLGISRATVRSYFQYDTLPSRVHHKSTNIDLFTNHIVSRLNNKGYLIKDIIDEIKELGYNGGQTQAYHNINAIKEKHKLITPGFSQLQKEKIPFVKPLNTRDLARLIGSSLNSIKDMDERKYMATLLDNIPELQIVRRLVRLFKTMLWRGMGNIERWIDFIKKSKYKLTGLTSFANGLLMDLKAVKNGINLPWSNGAVEGHVNRIKSIKRQMYGRAGFDLLRKKIILSQVG